LGNPHIQYFGFCQSVFSRALVLKVSLLFVNQYFPVRWFRPHFHFHPTPGLSHLLVLLSSVLLFAYLILINGCGVHRRLYHRRGQQASVPSRSVHLANFRGRGQEFPDWTSLVCVGVFCVADGLLEQAKNWAQPGQPNTK